jgi:dihydrolipoamide dehydrogenase
MKEEEAVKQLGNENILVGRYEYENTAKGEAMDVKGHGYFVKIIAERSTRRILGAHIVGPQASILIHEIINVMYTREQDVQVINQAIHIHPALSEVVQRAVGALRPVATRRHEHVEEAEPRRLTPKKAKPVTSESA